jgi:hypothetical protein
MNSGKIFFMAVPVTVYPSYSDPTNYSGVTSAVRSGGLITNPEHNEAVMALERTGRLGMTVFGLVQLPREVLMLQDERSAKTKAPTVSSTTRTTSDEDRLLSKVDDGTTTSLPIAPDGGGNGGPGGYDPPANDTVEAPVPQTAPVDVKTSFTPATPSGGFASQAETTLPPPAASPPVPNLLGRGNAVYLGVISSSSHIAGRNVSILT